MQVNISTRHGHLSDSSRAKVEAKIAKLARFFDRVSHIDVTVDLKNEDSPEVEILFRTENKHDFVAKEKTGNLLSSVEAAVRKVEQQIKKYKTKLQDHRGPGTGQASAALQESRAEEDGDLSDGATEDAESERPNRDSEPSGSES